MEKHTIISVAFGFFTPLIVPAILVGAIFLIGFWFEWGNEVMAINVGEAWGGGILCVGLLLLCLGLSAIFL